MFVNINNKNKINRLFVRVINKKTLNEEKNFIEICNINFDGERRRNSGGFNLAMSSDSSKLLVYENTPADPKNPQTYNLTVLDIQNNFKKIYTSSK